MLFWAIMIITSGELLSLRELESSLIDQKSLAHVDKGPYSLGTSVCINAMLKVSIFIDFVLTYCIS